MNKLIFIFLIFFYISSPLISEEHHALYGFALGTSMTDVSQKLGEPEKLLDLEDGSTAKVFIKKDHYVIFVSLPPKNDFIHSIQVSGRQSFGEQGVSGIQLGSTLKEALNQFGPPAHAKEADDQVTGEKVDKTNAYFYDNFYGNKFSFEEKNGIITSLKLTTDQKILSSDNPADKQKMSELPAEFQKVYDYILKTDRPELLGDKSYRTQIDDFRIADLDNDGLNEVIVLFSPHYLQSPTIVIYKIQKNGNVKRLKESLAPGPLVKRGDYFLDSHELGLGVDMTMNDKSFSLDMIKTFTNSSSKSKFGIFVRYRNFMHVDSRFGDSIYIDMEHVEPISDLKDCSGFEFSKVDKIKAGFDENKRVGFISAYIDKLIYTYEISKIDEDGFLEKKLVITDIKSREK
jgi:hypothetical protein